MAVDQAQVDALAARLESLNQMLADGVRSVTDGGQTVIYNTTDSLIAARDDVAGQLRSARAELAGAAAKRSRIVILQQTSRGYD